MKKQHKALEIQLNVENKPGPREELAPERASFSSSVYAALVIVGLAAYAGYIWLAARRGRPDDIELVALAWVPLVVTLLFYGSCACKSMAVLLHQGTIACRKTAMWIDRSLPK